MSSRLFPCVALLLAIGGCAPVQDDAKPRASATGNQALASTDDDSDQTTLKPIVPQLKLLVSDAKTAVDIFSKIQTGVSVAEKVLQLLGYLPDDGAAMQAQFDEIHKSLTQLGVTLTKEPLILARDKRLSDMRSDVNVVDRAAMKSGGAVIDQSVLSPVEIVELGSDLSNSQDTAQNAGDAANFQRYFSDSITDGDWKQLIDNRPGCTVGVGSCTTSYVTDDNLVFDWRLGVAEFTHLVAARIAIIEASEPDFKVTGLRDQELQQYRDRLNELYTQIAGGIQCGSHRASTLQVVCADVYTGVSVSTQVDEPACNIAGSDVCQSRIDTETARLTRKVMTNLPLFEVRSTIDALSALLDPDFELAPLHRIRLNNGGAPMCLSQSFVGVWGENPDDPFDPVLESDLWNTHVVPCGIDSNQNFYYDRETQHIVNDAGACLSLNRFELGENAIVQPCNGDQGQEWTFDPYTGVLENDAHSVLAGPPAPFESDAPRTEMRGAGQLQSWDPYALPQPRRSLLWQNVDTGDLATWILDTSGNVVDSRWLSQSCAPANCASGRVAGTLDLNRDGNVDLLWHNPTTGQVSVWLLDSHGTVIGQRQLSWPCGPDCAQEWSIIATLDVNHDGQADVLWQNSDTGEISSWLLDRHGNVNGARSLSWTCDEGCARTQSAVAALDVDTDGNTDLLWHDTNHGDLTAWLLDGDQVTGTKSLSWLCGAGDGCSQAWRVVGAADLNGDSLGDVLFYNEQEGGLVTWLLDGSGGVIGEQWLSWPCDSASGCAAAWKPVGLISAR